MIEELDRVLDLLAPERVVAAYRETGATPASGCFLEPCGPTCYACPMGALALQRHPVFAEHEVAVDNAAVATVLGLWQDDYAVLGFADGFDRGEQFDSVPVLGEAADEFPAPRQRYLAGYARGQAVLDALAAAGLPVAVHFGGLSERIAS